MILLGSVYQLYIFKVKLIGLGITGHYAKPYMAVVVGFLRAKIFDWNNFYWKSVRIENERVLKFKLCNLRAPYNE